ncbi:MAG: chromosomal replication initiator protein DnaA [Capsulimonadaceae bacterium]
MSSHPSPDDHQPEQQLELGEDDRTIALRRAWDRVLRSLAATLTQRNVDNFLRPLTPLSYDGETVVLGAPSAFAREWVEKKYAHTIHEALEHLLEGTRKAGVTRIQIRFVLSKPEMKPVLGEQPLALRVAVSPDPAVSTESLERRALRGAIDPKNPFFVELSRTPLNEKYTFENFVVGKSNRLAEAGARAVAKSPGCVYNPLFLYGSPGLGKTHLMHAIGHELRRNVPGLVVACISGEMFTNHYVASLRDKRSEEFRRAYRNVDVWLVDDIQTIASMVQTKEEFFHTFNTLHQMSKQIVITSDRSPRELRAMDERLRSRFECGLTADISPPELEMRTKILEQKASRENLRIPSDVIAYMANLIQSNIRALEGALIKLIAYASLVKSPITKQLASDVLSSYFLDRLPGQTGSQVGAAGAAADMVIDAVAVQLGIDRELIVNPGCRRKDVTFARQTAMYLCREMSRSSMSTLAETFGCKNHTAIAHAHTRMREAIDADPKLLGIVAGIRKVIEYSQ